MERVLIESFSISKRDEKKLLEIRLPLDAAYLTGAHVSVRFPAGHSIGFTAPHSGIFTWYPNYVVGDLRLFTTGRERSFYSSQLSIDNDQNLAYGDVSQIAFPAKPWTHMPPVTDTRIFIPVNARLVKGYYRDRMREFIGFSPYQVRIYLRYQLQPSACSESTALIKFQGHE